MSKSMLLFIVVSVMLIIFSYSIGRMVGRFKGINETMDVNNDTFDEIINLLKTTDSMDPAKKLIYLKCLEDYNKIYFDKLDKYLKERGNAKDKSSIK